ncbi:uncharacterized protein LOC130625011 [Hydractinia symbiolongicarpus]|uniref:uncharacterized protein LOC130625011 n=1 Tax=Hydractinia symbiolongicarpus TaxID=13093 RepID=UPI00254EEBCB|nr:uncharacterized protein LOC130625011 [Hydractinia symbiolongicarpus]
MAKNISVQILVCLFYAATVHSLHLRESEDNIKRGVVKSSIFCDTFPSLCGFVKHAEGYSDIYRGKKVNSGKPFGQTKRVFSDVGESMSDSVEDIQQAKRVLERYFQVQEENKCWDKCSWLKFIVQTYNACYRRCERSK